MLRHSSIVALFGAAAFVQCVSANDGATSLESDHTAGEITNANSPYLWNDTDYASFATATEGGFPGVALTGETMMTGRIQRWADAIDVVARKMQKARTGSDLVAPRPKMMVFNSTVKNAWVSTTPGCLGGPVDISAVSFQSSANVDATGLEVNLGLSFGLVDKATCVDPLNWPNREDAVHWRVGRDAACKLEVGDGGGLVVKGEPGECFVGTMGGPSPTVVPGASLGATSSWVHVTTNILKTFPDEKVAAFVIAHELSHYYRAHGSEIGDYSYFYEQTSPALPGKPPHVEDSDALNEELARLFNVPTSPKIAGSKTHSRLRPFAIKVMKALAQPQAASAGLTPVLPECGGLYDFVKPFEGQLHFGRRLTSEQELTWLGAETRLLECADKTLVGDQPGATLKNASLQGWEQSVFGPTSWGPENTTIAQRFAELTVKAVQWDEDSAAFQKTVVDRHLGIYTTEQEADDLAMDLLASLGMNPAESVEAWWRFTQMSAVTEEQQTALGADGLSLRQCTELYRDGWTKAGEDGVRRPVVIPLGDITEPHHGNCYRLFNLTRERDAHQYVVQGAPPIFDQPWSDVQAAAAAALEKLTVEPAVTRHVQTIDETY